MKLKKIRIEGNHSKHRAFFKHVTHVIQYSGLYQVCMQASITQHMRAHKVEI